MRPSSTEPAEPLGPVPMPTFEVEASPAELQHGLELYAEHCIVCHGPMAVGGGSGVPDLRHSTAAVHEAFDAILLGGSLAAAGMPRFDDLLGAGDARAIQAFILEQARLAAEAP